MQDNLTHAYSDWASRSLGGGTTTFFTNRSTQEVSLAKAHVGKDGCSSYLDLMCVQKTSQRLWLYNFMAPQVLLVGQTL